MLRIQKFLQIILILILTCPFSFAVTNNQKNSGDEYLSAEKLTTFIQEYLEKEGIHSYPAIDRNKKFPNCNKPLSIFPMFNSWSTVEILCTDQANQWKIMIRTRAKIINFAKNNYPSNDQNNLTVIAAKSLAKGHVLNEEDLEVVSVKKSTGTGIFKNKTNLIGRKLKRNVSVGFPLRSRHLYLNWVINDGDIIEIEQSRKTISVSVKGMALQNGQKGEKIKVKNLSSERNLVAWVINEKKVTTNAKIFSK